MPLLAGDRISRPAIFVPLKWRPMKLRPSTLLRIGAALISGAVVGGLIAGVAGPTAAEPSVNADVVDSATFATPGGHGNFRWRYSSSKKSQCGIYPTGRSYTVRCAAKIRPSDTSEESSEKSPYDAIEIDRKGVRRTTMSADDAYSGAKRLYPNQTIDVVGITCTAFQHATITCKKGSRSFEIVGGVAKS